MYFVVSFGLRSGVGRVCSALDGLLARWRAGPTKEKGKKKLKGDIDAGHAAQSAKRAGGYIRNFLVYDMAVFLGCVGVMAYVITSRPETRPPVQRTQPRLMSHVALRITSRQPPHCRSASDGSPSPRCEVTLHGFLEIAAGLDRVRGRNVVVHMSARFIRA